MNETIKSYIDYEKMVNNKHYNYGQDDKFGQGGVVGKGEFRFIHFFQNKDYEKFLVVGELVIYENKFTLWVRPKYSEALIKHLKNQTNHIRIKRTYHNGKMIVIEDNSENLIVQLLELENNLTKFNNLFC